MKKVRKEFLLLFIYFVCLNFLPETQAKIVKREVNKLIICDKGEFTAQCTSGTTVFINSAVYGRQATTTMCSKHGLSSSKICKSKTTLDKIRNECRGKNRCFMRVNADTMGDPTTDLGEACADTSHYLELRYSCESDCDPPYVDYNVQVLGSYHIGSTAELACRPGYERYGGIGTTEIMCTEDGTWLGGSILCKDVDECMVRSTNACHKHAECINSQGSYSCRCMENYSGDGFTCTSDSWFDANLNGFGNDTVQEYFWDEADMDAHDENLCGSRIYRLRRGTIKSPMFPRFYPPGSACTWIMISPPGLMVEIVFTKFQLENAHPNEGCSRDNVTLYDGLSKNPYKWIGTYCGDKAPPKIVTTTNQLRVEFRSDFVGNFPGFEATFSARNLANECRNFDAEYYRGVVVVGKSKNETTKPGDNITLACDQGYRKTSLDLVRFCLDDGEWSNVENPCTAVSCGPPIIPEGVPSLYIDGNPEQFAYGKLPVKYACGPGFRLRVPVGTDGLLYCDKRGEWSNAYDTALPTCDPFKCEVTEEEVPLTGHADWKVYNEASEQLPYPVGMSLAHGSRIVYSCKDGYALISDEVRECAENGWTGRKVQCEEDNGIAGLSNLQIAIIAACISGAIIILVGIGVIFCCLRNRKKRRNTKQGHQRRMRGARDNNGFVMNYAAYPTGPRSNQRSSFAGRHNNLSAYSTPPPSFMQNPEMHDDFYNHAIAPRTNANQRLSIGPRPPTNNETFLSTGEIRAPVIPPNYIDPATSRGGTLPMPHGYNDPPPSYDTMVRNGKPKNKSSKRKKKK